MDHISNLLTSLRNAERAGHSRVIVPFSKLSLGVLAILKKAGYILSFEEVEVTTEKKKIAIMLLNPLVLHNYKRISKPGRRLYTPTEKIPIVLRGLGLVILSTSKGVMTGKDAHRQNLGGEIICEVY